VGLRPRDTISRTWTPAPTTPQGGGGGREEQGKGWQVSVTMLKKAHQHSHASPVKGSSFDQLFLRGALHQYKQGHLTHLYSTAASQAMAAWSAAPTHPPRHMAGTWCCHALTPTPL
jgi:hypothetical protein